MSRPPGGRPAPGYDGAITLLLTMADGLNVLLTQTCETRLPPDQPRCILYGGRGWVRTLAVVQAGYESAASGRPVPIPERFPRI